MPVQVDQTPGLAFLILFPALLFPAPFMSSTSLGEVLALVGCEEREGRGSTGFNSWKKQPHACPYLAISAPIQLGGCAATRFQ